MPAQYEAIRDKLQSEGKSRKDAEKHAAMIYNARRPKGATPMGPHYEERVKKLSHAMAKRGVRG